MIGRAAAPASDTTLTIAPCERVSSGRNACVRLHDREVLFEHGPIAEVVVDRHAGIVDQHVERLDLLDGLLNLGLVGHVEDHRRDTRIRV